MLAAVLLLADEAADAGLDDDVAFADRELEVALPAAAIETGFALGATAGGAAGAAFAETLAGAGAEAASGLGSAFFYAGTRALLVTNWSVHSASARELITDLFRRQRTDPALSRSEALRQAMMALLDGPGTTDGAGHTIFSYAHPLFWAPYSLIGDGGGM